MVFLEDLAFPLFPTDILLEMNLDMIGEVSGGLWLAYRQEQNLWEKCLWYSLF
jgi:hypothetical protein